MMAAMDEVTTVWIKQEEMEDLPNDPVSVFLDDPLGVYWSTDHINEDSKLNFGWDENENNNAVVNTLLHIILEAESECCPPPLLVPKKELFHDDTFGISCLTDFIKEDPELNLEADETENIALKDPLDIGEDSLHVKEEYELKHHVDGFEHNVVASTSFASNMMRLTGNSENSCDISYEKTVNQGVINSKLEIDSEKSTPAMFVEEKEAQGSLFGTRLKCSLTENRCNKLSCSFCLQSFPSKYRLIMHVFVHIDGVYPPRFVCKSCGEVFSSHATLKKHLKMSEVDKALSADKSKKFDSSGDHRSTYLETDQEQSVIEQTENQCSSNHIWKTSEIQFETCNTHPVTHNAEIRNWHDNHGSLNTTGNLNAHTVVLPTKRRHKYIVSGESFTDMCTPKRLDLIHTRMPPHKCEICGKTFTVLGSLKTHLLIHSGTKPHKCNICGKSFTRLGHLKTHALVHVGRRYHKCEICDKSFTLLHDLKRHVLIHTDTKLHKCDICGKSFTQSSHLKRHELIHTVAQLHKCDICGKSFTQLCHVKRHKLIHSGTKPHKCTICGKSFTLLAHLKRHKLVHTN